MIVVDGISLKFYTPCTLFGNVFQSLPARVLAPLVSSFGIKQSGSHFCAVIRLYIDSVM